MSIFDTFRSFVSKYADEAGATANALNAIVNALPIQRQDKDAILAEIARLETAPLAIADWLKSAKEPVSVTIKKSDIDKAVADYLKNNSLSDAVNAAVDQRIEAINAEITALSERLGPVAAVDPTSGQTIASTGETTDEQAAKA